MSRDRLHTTKHSHILKDLAAHISHISPLGFSGKMWALNKLYCFHFLNHPSVLLFVWQDKYTLKEELCGSVMVNISLKSLFGYPDQVVELLLAIMQAIIQQFVSGKCCF